MSERVCGTFAVALCVASLTCSQVRSQPQAFEAPPELLGVWGTTHQCSAHRAGVADDQRLHPYVIGEQWLQHGMIWCRLRWMGQIGTRDDLAARALLQCGEDSVLDYRARLRLTAQTLVVEWSDDFSTRPLRRCGS